MELARKSRISFIPGCLRDLEEQSFLHFSSLHSTLLSPLLPRKTRLKALSSWRLCKCSSQCPRVVVMCARALSISDPSISISMLHTPPFAPHLSLSLSRDCVCVRALIARLKAATEAVFTKYGHKVSHRSNDSLTEIGASKQDILGRTIKSWQNLNIIILFECALE